MKLLHTFIVLVVVNGVFAAVLWMQTTDTVKQEAPSFEAGNEAFRSYWREQIQVYGGSKAYAEFVRWAEDTNIDQQHTLAHIMGGLLYKELGEAGLAVCDSSFSFGCYHEFLGQAIHAGGLSVVTSLNKACVDHLGPQALSCQHGIGHGIQTYAGYDRDDLTVALEECRTLPYNDPIGGCYGGVFMEYNMRTMLSLDGVGPREGEGGDPHEPCNSLDSEFQASCYFWQPQWWVYMSSGTMDVAERYAAMGADCRTIGNEAHEQLCFEGIGNVVGHEVSYDPAQTIDLCQAAAAKDPEAALSCRAVAANTFFTAGTPATAAAVCEGLVDEAHTYCLKYSTNTFNQLERPK